jgi:hypothetical protein
VSPKTSTSCTSQKAFRWLLLPPRAAIRQTLRHPSSVANSFAIRTYEKTPFNFSGINTYKIAGLKVEQNQHLQKKPGVGGLSRGLPYNEIPASPMKTPARTLGAEKSRRRFRGKHVSTARLVRGLCSRLETM